MQALGEALFLSGCLTITRLVAGGPFHKPSGSLRRNVDIDVSVEPNPVRFLQQNAGRLELFSATLENQFIFHLFELLLCGVIVLVILKSWRASSKVYPGKNQLLLFITFVLLSASFAAGAVAQGSFLFFQVRLSEKLFDLLTHLLRASAWLLLAASALSRQPRRILTLRGRASVSMFVLPFAGCILAWQFHGRAAAADIPLARALDLAELLVLCVTAALTYLRPLCNRDIAAAALLLLCGQSLLHLGAGLSKASETSAVFWNFEQFAMLAALFVFALAIGEASRDLFDRVFVRLQVAFILLASLMTLVIIQTEKGEYLSNIRNRSDQLAQFLRSDVAYFQAKGLALPAILAREELLQRLTFGFGNLPELKLIRISSAAEQVSFEILGSGQIRQSLDPTTAAESSEPPDPFRYFAIQNLPFSPQQPGAVEFYVTREFFDQHIRRRIVVIFSLFTGMVALSTIMIGVVVRGAGRTILKQALEIERAQRELIQTSKLAAIGELAAGVAHEINNPATTILSMASFWLSDAGRTDAPGDPEDVREVMTQARRIAQITSALLTFSRRQVVRLAPVAVSSLIDAGLGSVADLFRVRAISVKKELAAHLPHARADVDSLPRALENLFRNAIDAMPGGGVLTIRAVRDSALPRMLRLEISDTGVGMDENTAARIFDPFFTTKEVGKGTGLGLSLVHGIIKEHSGTIAVESKPGAGTTFVLLLPAEG